MNLDNVVIAVSILWAASEIVLARLKHSQSTDRRLDKSSLRLLWIAIAVGVTGGILLNILRVGYFGNGSPLYPIAGLVLILLGLIVRWIAIVSLNRQFTVDVSITNDHRIVKTGIYHFVRHPAYAGGLLSFLGLGLVFANYLTLLVMFVPICSAFLYRIRVEEKALIDNFGDAYINYCASTKRLIPGIY
jgi:protein-S-isoprenylcysteine O-methyltransferase Ste14